MFLDGSFLKIGWPSITVFSSSDYRRVALTDYDRFPENVDGEGDAFTLASKRTTTFMSSGMTPSRVHRGGISPIPNGVVVAHMRHRQQRGSCHCITGETAAGGTGRVRTAGNIFSR